VMCHIQPKTENSTKDTLATVSLCYLMFLHKELASLNEFISNAES